MTPDTDPRVEAAAKALADVHYNADQLDYNSGAWVQRAAEAALAAADAVGG